MKSHILLTLSAASGLTQVLAMPYIERSIRELTGNKTITTTASAEYHVDGLPGLPKPVILTSAHAHSTKTGAAEPLPIVTPGLKGSRIAPESVHVLTTITVTPPFDTDSPEPTSSHKYTTAAYSEDMEQAPRIPAAHPRGLEVKQAGPAQQYTTLTFTFNTMTTTYTLALPNGTDASETPAPVIRSSRSFPLAPPSGTWTELNTMFTSTVPADVLRHSAPSSPVGAVETSASAPVLAVTPNSSDAQIYHTNPLPAPNPSPMEEAMLSVTTPTPSMPSKPNEQVRTTILNGGEGAVERFEMKVSEGVQGKRFSFGYTPDHEDVYAGKHNDANRNDEPESHDLSWYFTASYTDDSVSLTMQPCYYDWQCWPEPTSSNTEVFLPGVDGGRVAEATLPVQTQVATIRA